MNFKDVGCDGVNWIKVARDRVRSLSVVNTLAQAGRFLSAIRHPSMRMKHGSI
jgi:hypothetical protein